MQRKTFIILVAIFLLPFVLGTIYFQWMKDSEAFNTTNYGTLVSPSKKIDHLPKTIERHWTYIVLSDQCEQSCHALLKAAETTRVLSNEHMNRVKTLFVSPNPLPKEAIPTNLPAKIETLQITSEDWQAFKEQFADKNLNVFEAILLVDPLGDFMMYYPAKSSDAKRMLVDLKRLLKYSRIG